MVYLQLEAMGVKNIKTIFLLPISTIILFISALKMHDHAFIKVPQQNTVSYIQNRGTDMPPAAFGTFRKPGYTAGRTATPTQEAV